MAGYKGAGLVGAKGFESYQPIVAPKASAIITAAPNFSKLASWPDPFLPKNIMAKMPGGTSSSIPSIQEMSYQAFMTTPQGMGVYSRQPLLDPAKEMGWDPQKKSVRSFSTDLAIIDPLGSIENITGEFFGLQPALIGSGGTMADPLTWVGERQFGLENYPTRLMDYAFTTIPMIAMHLMGMQHNPGTPKNADGTGFFPFENSKDYWASLSNWKATGRPPTDDELYAEAKVQASAVSMSPKLLIPALYERYKWGRDVMVNALSSGNERTDYMAKKELEAVQNIIAAGTTGTVSLFVDRDGNPIGPIQFANNPLGIVQQLLGGVSQVARSVLTLVPGIGTPLADTLSPVGTEAERMWSQLSADQRRSLFSDAQMTTLMTDVVVSLPLLSGAGSLASALKAGAQGGDFMAWASKAGMVKDLGLVTKGMSAADEINAVTAGWSVTRATMNVAKQVTFDLAGMAPRASQGAIGGFGRTMLVMDRMMAAGWASMLGNWALESWVPGYAEAVGYDIDNSRPFSDSAVAGVLNNIGYFSSATGGLNTAQRMFRGIPKYTGQAAGKAGLLGEQEARFFSSHFGGGQAVSDAQQVWKRPDGAAPTPGEFRQPVMRTADSLLDGDVQKMEVQRVQREILDNPELAHLDPDERLAMANEDLLNSLTNTADRKITLAGFLNAAKSETSFVGDLMLTDAQRVSQNAVAKVGREIDDRMASQLSSLYSATWWQRQFRSLGIRLTPGDTVADFRAWFRSEAARSGWQFDEALATKLWGKDVKRWQQQANLWHARDFGAVNSEVIEAAKISPMEGLLAHPEDYFLMRADHLFTDRADLLRSAIRQRGTDAAIMSDDELRALVGREIRSTKELDEWWSRLYKKKGGKDDAPPADPDDVDLDELLDFIEETYSLLPGRHPIHSVDPLTADYPINALAERLGREKMYAVAYKPKGSIIAYRPTTKELAIRASKNAPDGYEILPPPEFTTGDTMTHVTTDVDAVLSQGLKAQTELAEEAGEGLMYHGTSSDWYVFDSSLAADHVLIGRGLYTTSSPRVAHSYGENVKVMRIPADARIFDSNAALTQDIADAMRADLAKGAAGRFGTWAARAGDPDLINPNRVGPGNWWAFLTNGLDDAIKQGHSYWNSFVGDWAASARFGVEPEFKNAFSEVLADMGFEGLTHIGGRNVGGLGEHKVIVMFNPDSLLARANATGIGMGGDVALGRSVSVFTSTAYANAAQERLTLAVRASRGEATVEEIIDHFAEAMTPMNPAEPLQEVAGRLRNIGVDWAGGNTRDEIITAAKFYYGPTMRPEAERLGHLVLDLDAHMFKPGIPVGGKPVALDPTIASAYSAGIKTPPSRLAQVDPAKIGQVRVARRTETSSQPTEIPRIAEAEVATLSDGVTAKALSARHGRDGFVYQPVFAHDIDKMIDEGLKAGKNELANPASWKANGSPMEKWDADYASLPLPMTVIRVRHMQGPSIFGDVPAGAIEVMKKDGTWEVLGRMDRPVQDPVPGEALNVWGSRLYDNMMADGVPIADRADSVWVEVTQQQYDDMMAFGTLEPGDWNRVYARDWEYVREGRMTSPGDIVLELDRAGATLRPEVNPAYPGSILVDAAPKGAIKRVWSYDNGRQDYVLAKEKGRYGLEAGDFYAIGNRATEMRANSNHLWVTDERAVARHAGWTDDAQQPLENQWDQPWSGVVEDPTAGAEPIYTHVSYVRLKDGTVVQAPFRDYPMNPGDIYLGNRTAIGRKYDSIFQGVRSWRMAEHHLATMARTFGGRYGFTAGQVELFKDRVEAYSRSVAYSPGGRIGEIKISPYANARLRTEEVNNIGKQIFGEGKVKNLVTGQMDELDYARLFADAHMQAYSLNLTSGIISRLKNFDLWSIGPMATIGADWLIPMLRFKASPIFRTSELLESKVFNALRGVNVSAEERKVFTDAGLAPNPNLLAADFGADPLLESMFTAGQSKAASESMAGIFGLDDLVAGEGTTGIASSYAIWRDVDDLLTKKGMAGLKDDIMDPARYKNGLMFDQQIESVKRELPLIIKARDPEAYRHLTEVLKVPDGQIARFIAEDRILYGKWQRGQTSFENLLEHSNRYVKDSNPMDAGQLQAMYATEDWKVIETMMRVASWSAQAEAFGTHFFGSYRSALERSINHPLLGIYPASWMYKSAKEWGRFLYDNRTFGHGDLRLGMFPAVAMNQLIEKINMTVAMNTGESWQEWLDEGPARNLLFLWNLLLPGDWSSLPLPLARPLRTIHRAMVNGEYEKLAPWNLAADTLFGPQGRGGIGIIRDINLSVRGIYDIYEYAAAPEPGQVDNLANGLSLDGHMKAPVDYDSLISWPDTMAPVNPPP